MKEARSTSNAKEHKQQERIQADWDEVIENIERSPSPEALTALLLDSARRLRAALE